jgi:hypothetical protein
MLPCDLCGEPGYLRHGPDGPYSMIFCDRCFRRREIRVWLIQLVAAVIFALFIFARWPL